MNSNIIPLLLAFILFSDQGVGGFFCFFFPSHSTDLMEDARWKAPLGLGVEKGLARGVGQREYYTSTSTVNTGTRIIRCGAILLVRVARSA